MLQTTAEVIDALGGHAAMQVLTGAVSRQVVSNWRRAKTFPNSTFLVINNALVRLGLAASDELWPMVRPGTRKKRGRQKRAGPDPASGTERNSKRDTGNDGRGGRKAKRRSPRPLARRAKRTPQTIVESKPVGVGDR